MSHFTVLVAANDPQDLEKKLLPYHEYECTGIEEYVEFVPLDMAEAQAKFEEYGEKYDHKTLEEFIPAWYGYEKNEEGVWGRRTNPNAQWDWWLVGGRWSGLLLLKNGKNANDALYREIDWTKMREKEIANSRDRYQRWQNLPTEEEARRKAIFDNHFFMITNTEVEDLETMTEVQYVDKYAVKKAMTYAFIDLQGRWQHRAEMGWFGLHGEEVSGYDEAWWQFVENLLPTQRLYVVDCHI